MTAPQLFSIANPVALAGWIILACSVIFKNRWGLRHLSARWWPLGFAFVYSLLILFFFAKAPGGFDSLANVQLLFTWEWTALAGWIHYLAFDLFMGAWIAQQTEMRGLPRLILLPLLPLTFLFGPMGLLGFEIASLMFQRPLSPSH
jgi:hypothetical protein